MNLRIIKRPLAILLLMSFIVPAVILASAYYRIGIYPGGTNTVLVADLQALYMPFWASLRYLGESDNSIFLTMSGALGNNFVAYACYGAFAPLTWMTVLFPLEQLPDVIYYLILVKIGMCGAGFCYYLWYTYPTRRHLTSIFLLSCCYALMSYNVGYSVNPMWLDAVLMLPWILVGIERILNGEKPILFITAVFISMLCNYYITAMSAIFSIGYLFIRLSENRAWRLKTILRYILYALLGAGMSAPVVLPAVLGLIGGKIGNGSRSLERLFRYKLLDLLLQFISGRYDTLRDDGLPLIFCGTGTLVLVLFYFIKSKHSWKIKFAWAGFILFYVFAMCFIPLDRVMHGFKETVYYEARYSFSLSCLLLIMAYRGVDSISDDLETLSIVRFLKIVSIVFVISELYMNSAILLTGISKEMNYYTRLGYDSELKSRKELLTYINDDGFYRISDYFGYTGNDGAWLNYNGVGYFSSCHNLNVMDFFGAMGERQTYHAMANGIRSPLEESLIGAKYIVACEEVGEAGEDGNESEIYTIKENDDALSLGYMVNLRDDNIKQFGNNAFENQNSVIKDLTGKEGEVFVELIPSRCEKTETDEHVWIYEYLVEAKEDATVWVYFERSDISLPDTKLVVDGIDMGEYIYKDFNSPYMIYLGRYEKGKLIEIETLSNADNGKLHIDYFDENVYRELISELASNQLDVTYHSAGHFCGTIDVEEDGIMLLSLPAIDGWRVKVDGKNADLGEYRNVMLTVNLASGKHDIDIRFVPPGLYFGVFLGGLCLLIFVIFIIRSKENCVYI
ncbi:MAG: YfhO family protein [Lachnospiraceae bacterium]|nr:YfhO family protein [Lachnospiraceae bacterium]